MGELIQWAPGIQGVKVSPGAEPSSAANYLFTVVFDTYAIQLFQVSY